MRRLSAVVVALALAGSIRAAAQDDPEAALGPRAVVPSTPGSWRFRDGSRRVKVVVLGGSIGAFMDAPYSDHFQSMCSNVEVKNISVPRLGAFALGRQLHWQVLRNRNVRLRDPALEHWLVFQGGLNSVANPWRTNAHIREIYEMAHQRGMRVVGLTLTPWGDEADRRRWGGAAGLRYWHATKTVVDFVMGRLGPRQALAARASERAAGADAPWTVEERADVAVDLYDSILRDREAPLRPVEPLRRALTRDPFLQRQLAEIPDAAQRAAKFDAELRLATEIPRWFLKRNLRSFDHIHPNREGHRLIAEIACPRLPASWGCRCPGAR